MTINIIKIINQSQKISSYPKMTRLIQSKTVWHITITTTIKNIIMITMLSKMLSRPSTQSSTACHRGPKTLPNSLPLILRWRFYSTVQSLSSWLSHSLSYCDIHHHQHKYENLIAALEAAINIIVILIHCRHVINKSISSWRHWMQLWRLLVLKQHWPLLVFFIIIIVHLNYISIPEND